MPKPTVLARIPGLQVLLFAVFWPAASGAQPTAGGNDGYVWNAMQGEKLLALSAKGDPLRGEISFEICQGCHRTHALGRPDGSYPRLAGQHDTVLIKQMTDVRAQRRSNPQMLPFVDKHVLSPQDIADIAAYLSRLPVPQTQGVGNGRSLTLGQRLFDAECASCHGPQGQGNAAQFYPRVNGQHYNYLLREMIAIRDGVRGNAMPEMVTHVKRLNTVELEAVADHMSRLPVDRP